MNTSVHGLISTLALSNPLTSNCACAGYSDGISQPAINGFGTPLPGQAVVSAGTILTGLLGDKFFGFGQPSWAREGSFLAFRKLKQLVPEFDEFTKGRAATIAEATPDLIGARMVGRWKSGECGSAV
jgi:deferrochelatase/peroxidase EfeB